MNRPGSTIAAVATALAAGTGSIAIVRISGPGALSIGQRVFRPAGQRQVWESHRVLYGHVVCPESGQILDEVLLLYMQAPRSFTGEDVVELHCHGGLICVQRVLEQVLAEGAEAAAPGAFSQRAVLNGRLDLTQAEAVAQMVSARSHRAVELALAGLDGGLYRRLNGLRQTLLEQLAELEARLDFEDDLPPLEASTVEKRLQEVAKDLHQLAMEGQRGERLQQGLQVAILGRPNVGKSSLLNRLTGYERAIVTELPGTTRDLLEAQLVLRGVPITLVDTAGIRQTNDLVEQKGIDRSRDALSQADVILLLFDASVGWSQGDQQLAHELPQNTPQLRVGNKVDLLADAMASLGPEFPLLVSANTGAGIEALIDALLKCCSLSDPEHLQISLSQRQFSLAQQAIQDLTRLFDTAEAGLPWDFWTIDLREAIGHLGEITGAEINESALDQIFSRFCIGK